MRQRISVLTLAVSGLFAIGVSGAATTPAAADNGVTLTKKAPASVLLGDDIPYELTAANAGPGAQYNAGFSDVLPAGFTYKPGSVSPAVGEPTITTQQPSGRTVLAWTNVTDLQANSDYTISFKAERTAPLPDSLTPSDTNDATVITQSNERVVPRFDKNGVPLTPPASPPNVLSQDSDSATTARAPFVIEKTEPSPEGELLRGVHDQRTVYTLKVRNNQVVPTEDITITDYLPAGMEFLGCGDEDNSQFVTEEYSNSGPLAPPDYTPAPSPCPPPVSVETVDSPQNVPGLGNLGGVFTAVTWDVGTLPKGGVYEIQYVAGIPLQLNTTTWDGGQTPPTTGEQGSNLDNNNFGSTRETMDEQSLTNKVSGTGYFTGSPEGEAVATGEETVTIEDLRMQKSVIPKKFTPGGIATFSLKVDASEYVDGSNIVLTDTLPDGFCPLGPANYAPTAPADCAPVAGELPSVDYTSVTFNANGTYTIVFDAIAVQANKTRTITFPARMRTVYSGTGKAGQATVAGDGFRNRVTLAGTTNPIPDVDPIEQGPQDVKDDSYADLSTSAPAIDKTMKPRYIGMDCDPASGQPYGEPKNFTDAQRTFRKGDKLCFKLRVNFADISTKNAVVTDFVPVGTEYIPGSAAPTGANTATIDNFDGSGPLVWKLGDPAGGALFVDPGQVFEVVLAARVLQPAGPDAPELTGNLMKMRTVNTAGEAESFRDEVQFDLAPPPNLSIKKGVASTTAPAATFNPPADGKPVQQGSTATFQVDLKNEGFPGFPDVEYSVRGVQTWDVLPPGIACAAISDYRYIPTSGGAAQALPGGIATCTDPPVNGQSASAYIKWTFPSPDASDVYSIAPGKTLSVLYDMAIPDPTSVSTRFDNTAYVRSMNAFTDETNQVATYYPEKNIDTSVPTEAWDSPEAKDPSHVYVEDVRVTKTAETSVGETGNDVPDQATIGETITYTYSAKIPARSTVYDASLSDSLPAGIELRSIIGAYLDGGALPGGFPAFDTNIGTNASGRLVFPTTYSNTTSAEQVFSVKVTAQVTKTAVACANETGTCPVPPNPTTNVGKQNTASFLSNATAGGAALPVREGKKTVRIVQPAPTLTKTANPTQLTTAGQEVTYSVQVGNTAGPPPLHDVVTLDCLPSPMEVVAGSIVAPAGATASIVSPPDCAHTGIRMTLAKIDPGQTLTLTYKAKLVGSVPAGQDYTNDVTLTGTSMPGTVAGERTYERAASATITSPRLVREKTITPEKATIGQTFTARIALGLLEDVNYYSAAVIDTLPLGVDPTSVQTVGVTCKYLNDDPCAPAVNYTPLTASGQKIGWSFGDVLGAGQQFRIVTVTYTAVIADVPGNRAGTVLENSAKPYWNTVPVQQPPTTIAGYEQLDRTTDPAKDTVTVIEPALSIVKKVDGQDAITATPDQPFTYTLKVTNATGDNVSTAHNITVTDDIPASIEVVGSPSDGGTVSGSTITWTIDSLAPGADTTVSFTARLKPPATTKQTNTATVGEYWSLPNKQGRKYTGPSDVADVTPILPVLNIAKEASAPLAYIDGPYTWTIKVSNPSGATAYGVDVADTLPPNWSYKANSAQVTVNGTTTQVNPAVAGQNLTWTDLADLPASKPLTIVFEAIPGPDVVIDPGVGIGIQHVNRTHATYHVGPPAQGWRTVQTDDAAAHTEIASADLMLEKTHRTDYPPTWNVANDEVVPGTEFEWLLKVTNNGPDTSAGPFIIKDTLPDGIEYRGYQVGTDWSCNAVAQVVTCTHPGPTLAKGASLPDVVLTVGVEAGVTGELKNSATVTGKTYDPKPDNNKAEDEVTARPLADVAIEKTRTQPYVVGNQVTYTLAVTNLGPSVSVKDITVVDTLPTGLSIASIDAGAWQCQPTSGETDKLTCILAKDLAPNEQAPLIKVTVDVLESPGAEAVNTATVTPTTEDQNLGNNTSTVTDPVVSEVQLGIAKKTTGANPVTAGTSTEFTITVTNAGPAKAKNVQVVDQLEAGLKATSATGPGWTCDVGSGTIVTCTRANFPVSASPSDIVIKADVDKAVPGGTTLKNVATVTTTSPQPGGDPPPATSTVAVVAKSDLAITKTHDGGPWTIGKTGTWRVRVINNGPSDNPGPITVVDNLPRGNEFLSATGDGWTCSAASRTVTCIHAAGLVVGQASAFSIRVNVVDGAAPSLVNPAEVSSPIEDPDPSNNKSTDQVPVERAKQTAERLPPDPRVFPARTTEQGQKIRTKVRCRTIKSSAAGEVSYCKVRTSKNGTVRVKVIGSRAVRVIVTQFAKGTKNYKPFKRVKTYIVRP